MQPRLDRQICLLKRTVQRDAEGLSYETWALGSPVWVGRERVTANEQSTALQTRGIEVDKLRLRFIACLEDQDNQSNYRVRMNGKDYKLISCVEDLRAPRRQWMIMTIGYVQGEPTLTVTDVPAAV